MKPLAITPADRANAKPHTLRPLPAPTLEQCREMARGAGITHPLLTSTDDQVADALFRITNGVRPRIAEVDPATLPTVDDYWRDRRVRQRVDAEAAHARKLAEGL